MINIILNSYYSKSSDAFPEFNEASRKQILCSLKQSRSDNFIPC